MSVTQLPQHPAQAERRAEAAPRWHPARAGILNLWRYYDEVFEFHDGRLLLRGPNGTGKSKALELLLPYLLDANLRANRLSTFGTSERTMHWNLMGEGATGTTRVGYAWLEFAARAEGDGSFTCGARLQASTHTSSVNVDYFTTDRRVGTDLALTNDSGQPLTRAALIEEMGERGAVHPNAAEYRHAVRQTLFPGLSEARYDAMITALLQLRTPKLSQRLDPALLSTLLSRALPPLAQEDIAELAEGFERLDRQRERLARLDEEAEAARTVAARQRSYSRQVLRASSAKLISAHSEMDRLTRVARESEEDYQRAGAERERVEERREELAGHIERARAGIEGLQQRDSYTKGRELDDLRRTAGKTRQAAAEREAESTARAEDAASDAADAERASGDAERQAETVRRAADDTQRAAQRVGMEAAHTEIAQELAAQGEHGRSLLTAAVHGKQDQIAEVRTALESYERAVDARTHAEAALEGARSYLSEEDERRAAARETYQEVLAAQRQALRDWGGSCTELVVDDLEELEARAESEAAVLDYLAPFADRCSQWLTAEETTLTARRGQAEADRRELAATIEELRGTVDLPPEPPPHRTADRARMPGAPLWKLVAFAEGVGERTQATVEAALQASGLLDAWVTPSGSVSVDGHDTFAVAGELEPAPDRSLATVLRPEGGAAVPDDQVWRLLSAVAFGDTLPAGHPAAVAADGRWRLGAVTGSWAKDESAHIGALARERHRQRRIAEFTARVDALDDEIATLGTELDVLAGRRRTLAAERGRRPSHEPVESAKQKLDAAEAAVTAADRQVRRASEDVERRERHANQALRALSLAGSTHGVPTGREALTALEQSLATFRENAEVWLSSHGTLVAARDNAERLRVRAARSEATAQWAAETAKRAASEAEALTEKVETVQRAVGAEYQQVLAELDELRGTLGDLEREEKSATAALLDLRGRIGSLEDRRVRDREARDAAVAGRDAAGDRLRHLLANTFPQDAGLDLEPSASDGVKATLEAARAVAARWPDATPDPNSVNSAFARLSEAVHACRENLSGRADLELVADDDVQVLTAVVDGVRVGAHEMSETLHTEATRAREEITTSERDLFDKTLTGDTRRHLAERIRQAGQLVEAMNARLEQVRTASDVSVRLVWQVDQELPAGTRSARELLLKDPVRLSESDRESLHRFFRDRIEQARAENTAASWQEQLAEVFDYTAWHRFVVKLDRGDGRGPQPLTRRLHGALSGGEKAIALHLPLFAAIAAHYQSVPEAPRLILLDEVFVGVDSRNRGQVFELLTSLDLDLMLTSDHEWCAYRELPGIAVHQLITGDDEDEAVTTARFVWSGGEWEDERP